MRFSEYKNITIEPELGVDIEARADEVMNAMAAQGWQVVCVSPHVRAGKLIVTFGREKA